MFINLIYFIATSNLKKFLRGRAVSTHRSIGCADGALPGSQINENLQQTSGGRGNDMRSKFCLTLEDVQIMVSACREVSKKIGREATIAVVD